MTTTQDARRSLLSEGARASFHRVRYDINGRATHYAECVTVVYDEGLRIRIKRPDGREMTAPKHLVTAGWGSIPT